jgi:hypothetical protein
MHGTAGMRVFFALSSLSLLISWYQINVLPQFPQEFPGRMYRFDWSGILPNWRSYVIWTREHRIPWISLDRKTKVVFLRDRENWLELLSRFPLNMTNWKRIGSLPDRIPVMADESKPVAYPDFFGFWRYATTGKLVPDEQAKHLNVAHRDWKEYPFRLGGKRKWQTRGKQGPKIAAGPVSNEGDSMWVE